MAQVSDFVERAVSIGARVFAVAVGLIFGAVVAVEMGDRAIAVEEISTPAELAERGYTPSVIAYQILNEWKTIDDTATTTKRRKEVGLGRGQVELSLPGVDISISSIVDYFRAKLGITQERLRGGVVIAESDAPECAEGCYTFLLNLEGRYPSYFSVTRPKSDIDGLIRTAARLAVEKLDPYLLANFYFASTAEAEPNREAEIYRIVGVVLSAPPADDDPWGLTLLGVMLNRQQRWAEAIDYFDRALELERLATALNSRCWARAHLPDRAAAAIPDCREALRLNPDSFETMDSLAFALEQNGQQALAFDVIKCARRIADGAASVEATYARLYAAQPAPDPAPLSQRECAELMS